MARPKKKRQQKKRGRIKFKQSARLVHKNDATRVDKSGAKEIMKVPVQMPRDNGLNMRVKIRRKTK